MKEYLISVDPRILELLGPSLYTNIYYVLAELIANAYDADAKNVYISSTSEWIRVEDDGNGMSYESGDIQKYLSVAKESRDSEENSMTASGSRRKMGRKGIGKIAALSVSENVEVLTCKKGEKSGFILTRHPKADNTLEAIPDEQVRFEHVKGDGTAVVMLNPQYKLNISLNVIKKNLLKIFPLVNESFRIHIIRDGKKEIIDCFDQNIATELSTIITLGQDNIYLSQKVPNKFPDNRDYLVENRDSYKVPVVMTIGDGVQETYELEIEGWIGTYKSTRGRKAVVSDFPDNFISLFANKKLGEFNILPLVGQNKLNEVFVVGQLHIDLFEKTELPDMALSNRQGYKSDDPRYETVLKYVRETLLPDILKKRDKYADLDKAESKKAKMANMLQNEEKLRKSVESFKGKTVQKIVEKIGDNSNGTDIKQIVDTVVNENMPQLGIKTKVDAKKKKILISHTYRDKGLADVVYQMLLYNSVPAEDILYTNCDDEICRIPEGVGIYNYLREFFVDSYSTEKIYVIFITSKNTQSSWGALCEVGASWITQINNKIFNIHPFAPQHPLNDESEWHTTHRDEDGNLTMTKLDIDKFCVKIEGVCQDLGYEIRSREENKSHLGSLVSVVS